VSGLLRGFGGAFVMHVRLHGTHPYRLFQVFVMPAFVAVLAVLVLRSRGATDLSYVAIGAGLTGMWASLLGTSLFTMAREREWYGTFELIAGVPNPLGVTFAGYLFADAASSLLALPTSVAVAALFADVGLDQANPVWVLCSLVVTAVAMFALAMTLAPLIALIPVLTRWANALEYPVWILGAFLFSLAVLPGWLSSVSPWFTPYWASLGVREAAAGSPVGELLPIWGRTLALSAGYLVVAGLLFRAGLARMRRTGALAHG
jgi:ABC-2 type transport system permease protein